MSDVCHECGAIQQKGRRRSRPHHNRLFAIIDVACDNWPEDHEFQPEGDTEKLRAYLLCSAGYRDGLEIPLEYSENDPSVTKASTTAIQAALEWAGSYAFVRPNPRGGSVAVYRAKSIAWAKLPQKDFAPLAEAVEQIIENVIGVKADTLLKNEEAAA